MTEHTYPSNYMPGPDKPASINVAWSIIDTVTPGVLSPQARALLAGMIAASLDKAAQDGKVEQPPDE